MAAFKVPDFKERTSAARDARQRALDQLRNKLPPDPAIVAEKVAAAAAREAAAAERRRLKEVAREQALAAKREADAAAAAAIEAAAAAIEAAKPKPPQLPSAAEMKAARDIRYAARKERAR